MTDDERRPNETPAEQLDRNWFSLLQELRVVQTGVQILTGLLLTLPFQQRFEDLDHVGRIVYIVAVCSSVLATAALVAPVIMHRLLFRRYALARLVRVAHLLTILGVAMLGISVTAVLALIFGVVLGPVAASTAAGVGALLFVLLWLVLPFSLRRDLSPHAGPHE
ncbi:DUF6328 family protein [Gordonia zhaorongruii]|uniref:DUF6328 family protein n=1 Tax=Gordonia zhaorongruii TaxID=2597659 RepID=UPI001048D06B|nr:DUF6328 family protein [Gordonia zhaorongruii]